MQLLPLRTTLCFLLFATFLGAQPQTMLNQAEALRANADYEASNQLLDAFISKYPNREYDLGDVYYQKSRNYYALGALDKAAAANSTSMEIRLPFGAEDLGKNYLLDGRIALGELRLPDALVSLQLADQFPFMDDPLLPAEVQRLIGEVYVTAGQTPRGLRYYDKALDNTAVLAGQDSDAYRRLLLQKAQLMQAGAPDSAKALLTLLLEDKPSAVHHQALGDFYRQQGGWAAATGQYQQAYTRTASDGHLRKAELLLRLGQMALRQGQSAEEYARQCIKRLCPQFNPKTAAGLPQSRASIRDRPLLIQALQLKAEQHLSAYRDRGQDKELAYAAAAARLGVMLFEEEIDRYQAYPLCKRQALPLLQVFDPLLYALSAQGEAEAVFAYADRVAQWRMHLMGLLEQVSAIEASEWRQRIEPGQALLAYHYGQQFITAVAINSTEVGTAIIPLADATGLSLAAAVTQFRQAISGEDGAGFSTLGYRLQERLLGPLVDVVAGKFHLQIYRSGPLEQLPFEALLVEKPKKRRQDKYHSMDFLGETTAISYSSRPAQTIQDRPIQWPNGLLVVPSFKGEAGQLGATGQLMATLWTPDAVNTEGRIEASVPEVNVGGLARYLRGEEATEANLVEALPQHDCILLSAPFAAREDSPMRSAFLLAQDTDSKADGIWRLLEWADQLQGKGVVIIGVPDLNVARVAQRSGANAILFAEAPRQALLEALVEDYANLPLAQATLALRKAKAKKRKTAAPRHWVGLWGMAP